MIWKSDSIDRRTFVRLAMTTTATLTAGGLVAACGGSTPQGTTGGGSAFTGPQQTVRIGDTVAIDNPEITSEKHFGDRLAALTNNHYQVKTFPNSVLGTAPAMNEQVRSGTLEMTKSNVASLTGFDKRLAVLSLPYSFATRQKLWAAQDGKLGQAYGAILEQHGFKLLAWFDSGDRNVYNKIRPVHHPSDLKGLRIRLQPDPVMIDTFNTLGATAVPLETAQIYSALQQGVIDGAENNVIFFFQSHHNEIADKFSNTHHFWSIDPLLVSLKWFNAQPKAGRDAIVQAGKGVESYERQAWLKETQVYVDKAKAAGVKFNDLTNAGIAEFQKATKPVWQRHSADFGDLFTLLQQAQ